MHSWCNTNKFRLTSFTFQSSFGGSHKRKKMLLSLRSQLTWSSQFKIFEWIWKGWSTLLLLFWPSPQYTFCIDFDDCFIYLFIINIKNSILSLITSKQVFLRPYIYILNSRTFRPTTRRQMNGIETRKLDCVCVCLFITLSGRLIGQFQLHKVKEHNELTFRTILNCSDPRFAL